MMKKLICLLFISLIIISGCFGKSPAIPDTSTKGSIKLVISPSGLSAKTIQPDLDMTIATYDIYGAGPNGTNFRKDGQTDSTVVLEALAAGLWTITVDAKNSGGIIIASGYTTVTVVAGVSANAEVTVTPLEGTGTLKVNLSWPGGTISNPIINATLAPKGGAASNITFTLAGDSLSALYENNALEAGYYTLLVYLYDGTVFKWGAAEAVRIIKGQTSEGNYPVIPGGGDIGDISLIITPDLQNPIGITFSGAAGSLSIGTNMTVTATTSEAVDTYQWYLNGKPLSGATSDTITIGSSLPEGNYRLDLLVTKRMIISSGTVYFSVNGTGGLTPTPVIATPTPTPGYTSVINIAAGADHNLFLDDDGTVWAWGYNNYGQLGNGSFNGGSGRVQVAGLTGVVAVDCGGFHSLALKNDGTVWSWGKNEYGQLGDGTTTNRSTPARVGGLTGIVAIASGNEYILATKNDGTVWFWGSDLSGMTSYNPVRLTGITGTVCTAGVSHSYVLNSSGIWGWGWNSYGQLGNGTYTNQSTPVLIFGPNDFISIKTGNYHSLGLKSDGTVWTWGWNLFGQLGDGTNTDQNVPKQVPGLSGIIAISGGHYHNIALKNDGSIWAWGENNGGQLGDGTYTGRNVPVRVNGF